MVINIVENEKMGNLTVLVLMNSEMEINIRVISRMVTDGDRVIIPL